MLVAYLPEQVDQLWELVAPEIIRSLPQELKDNPYVVAKVYEKVMTEEAVLWGWFEAEEKGPRALVLTVIDRDPILETRRCFIYAIVALAQVHERRIWKEAIATLQAYAKSRHCRILLSYTDNPGLSEVLRILGWDTRFTQLVLEV